MSSLGLSKPETDATILTSSVDASYEAMRNSQTISDQATIRNAVSSASLDDLGSKPLAWANAETRSRGTITDLVEARQKAVLCRSFKASRESFDGVAIYRGEACLGPGGSWFMREFAPA